MAAHLDAPRREALFAALPGLGAQVFLTGTDIAVFAPLAPTAQGFAVRSGEVRQAGFGAALGRISGV